MDRETALQISEKLTEWGITHTVSVVIHEQYAPSPQHLVGIDTFRGLDARLFRAYSKLAAEFGMEAGIDGISHALRIQDPPTYPHVHGMPDHKIPEEYFS